jgi:hypothetical protein
MTHSRFIGVGFLALCGAVLFSVWQGLLAPSAPFEEVVPVAQREPVTVELAYGTEKEAWLEESVERWLETEPTVGRRPVRVELTGTGSQEIVQRLEDGSLRPTAVSPASTAQVNQVNALEIEGQRDTAADSEPLVRTPLVLALWEPERPDDPATTLLESDDPWRDLHRTVVENASDRSFLFGQTAPDLSNSGLQTFTLLACAYHDKSAGLTVEDVEDPGFGEWMAEYAGGVARFDDSTGTLMEDMVRYGPARYGAVAVYESTVLDRIEAAENRQGTLRLVYPPTTLVSDHPYAVLNGPWVEPEEREASVKLREFLLSEERQRAAVGFGFRPVRGGVEVDGSGSPFVRYREQGAKVDAGEPVEEPGPEVVEALLRLWSEDLEPGVGG